jgi:hypothetical protein
MRMAVASLPTVTPAKAGVQTQHSTFCSLVHHLIPALMSLLVFVGNQPAFAYQRAPVYGEVHDFMEDLKSKTATILPEELAPLFLGTQFYLVDQNNKLVQTSFSRVFPKDSAIKELRIVSAQNNVLKFTLTNYLSPWPILSRMTFQATFTAKRKAPVSIVIIAGGSGMDEDLWPYQPR